MGLELNFTLKLHSYHYVYTTMLRRNDIYITILGKEPLKFDSIDNPYLFSAETESNEGL